VIRQEECKMKWEASRNEDTQGGMLYLTDHRLIFEGNIGGLLSKRFVTAFQEKLEDIHNVSIATSMLGVKLSRSGVGLGNKGIMIESSQGLRTFVGIEVPQLWLDSTMEKIHARREHIEDMLRKEDEQRRIEDEKKFTREVELKWAVSQKEIVKEIRQEVVMVPCRYCGGLMPDTSSFCMNCGAKRSA
jgi:hypothetical protein